MVKNILINFPTNLGDTILGLPVLDRLAFNYPQAKITAIASFKNKDFLLKNSLIKEVIVFDKFWKFHQKFKFSFGLRGRYDLMVDLKNTALPLIIGVKNRTPFRRRFPKSIHARDEYLSLIEKIAPNKGSLRGKFILSQDEERKWQAQKLGKSIFIACSSREQLKRYPYEYLKKVIERISGRHRIVILGLEEERGFYKDILSMEGVVDLVGKTQMHEVFFLLKNFAILLLCVDSSIMHLASYIDLPIIAIFGFTSHYRYGPWSSKSLVLRKENSSGAKRRQKDYSLLLEQMEIDPQRVLEAIEKMLVDA